MLMRRNLLYILIIAIGLIVLSSNSKANQKKSQIGIYSGSHIKIFMEPDDYNNIHPLFEKLDNYTTEYYGGDHWGVSYRYFFGKNTFFSGKIGYLNTHHKLTGDQEAILTYDDYFTKAKVYHEMDFDMHAVSLNTRMGHYFGKKNRWYGMLGLSLNLYTINEIDYRLGLDSPNNEAAFKNSGYDSIRYNDIGMRGGGNDYEFAISTGLGYNYPFEIFNQKFTAGPHGEFAFSVNSLSQMIDKRTFTVSGGLELYYEFNQKAKKSAQVDIAYYFVNPEKDNKNFIINKYITKKNLPLINYIFFDIGETELPDRYKTVSPEKAEFFYEEDLKASSPIMVYYHIMDILGRRMSGDESIKITLTQKSTTKEELRSRLFFKRGKWIQDYLVKTWGIAKDRVVIKLDTELVSRRDYPVDHIEIQSNNHTLFYPVTVRDTSYSIHSKALAFNVATEDSSLKEWMFSANLNGKQIATMNGLDEMDNSVEYSLENDNINEYTNDLLTISYEFNISENDKYLNSQRQNSLQIRPSHDVKTKNLFYITWINKSSFSMKDMVDFPWVDVRKASNDSSKIHMKAFIDKSLNPTIGKKVAERRLEKVMQRSEFDGIQCEVEYIEADPTMYNPNLPEMVLYHRCIELTIED
jgi:hypothetical protein